MKVGACSKKEIDAKCEVVRENYIKTVEAEIKSIIDLANQKIVPRGYKYLQSLSFGKSKKSISKFADKFTDLFDSSLESLEELESLRNGCDNLKSASFLRSKLSECGEILNKVVKLLEKDEKFPDLEDFLHL